MAQYKVLQDIEAEDHILGPLSLKQFIYSIIAIFFIYLCYIVIAKNIPYLLIIFLPPVLFFGFLAYPFGRDQPTEIWALAKLRFFFKPHKRVWSQSGIKDTVTITAPKHAQTDLTDSLTQTEIISRLESLALTLDTRGWAIKSANIVPAHQTTEQQQNDRLIDLGTMPRPVPDYDISAEEDMLDVYNPIAKQMNNLIDQADKLHRQKIIYDLNQVQPENEKEPTWFDKEYEDKISAQLKANITQSNLSNANLHSYHRTQATPQPPTNLNTAPKQAPKPPTTNTPSPPTSQDTINPQNQPSPIIPNSDIVNLARNKYLSIATIRREAHKSDPQQEVTINLH